MRGLSRHPFGVRGVDHFGKRRRVHARCNCRLVLPQSALGVRQSLSSRLSPVPFLRRTLLGGHKSGHRAIHIVTVEQLREPFIHGGTVNPMSSRVPAISVSLPRVSCGIPQAGFHSEPASQELRSKGVPASKLLPAIGFYGRGWTGVTQEAPGGSATGAAPGTYEAGIDDYKVLTNRCPATRTIAEWWSYETPATIRGTMSWVRSNGLGGAFSWELSGDTSNGELITAISSGLG
jgi:Glycosyl hydrolases family 18